MAVALPPRREKGMIVGNATGERFSGVKRMSKPQIHSSRSLMSEHVSCLTACYNHSFDLNNIWFQCVFHFQKAGKNLAENHIQCCLCCFD